MSKNNTSEEITSAVDSQNPCGLDGVEFVEFTGPDKTHFQKLFAQYGFKKMGAINSNIELYRQGQINFIINCEAATFASNFSKQHGPSICGTGFRVFDAEKAFQVAVKRGAKPFQEKDSNKSFIPFPAIYGIGDSLIYFVDQKNSEVLYKKIFQVDTKASEQNEIGLGVVDHFTNNVPVGEMQKWCDFYTQVFNFRETRYFNIQGKQTGLISKVMRSPCGKFAVPINEPTDKKSQIQEYLDEYRGSGIQHLALTTSNIITTLEKLRQNQNDFLASPPETYYKMLKSRLPDVIEDLDRLKKNAILVDGDHEGYLLQIFSKNIIGPIFFEIIQRKGHSGFGEGNFQALFDAIEQDQRERGYL
jgi:4-hydroxyphenylpyruvate dioxygenase